MKITVYTVTDCQFSKTEKEYLASHTLQFEEKNLETNKEFLTEMLAVSNNFAGTPVSKVEKDDGTIVVLKGFTKEEFDEALGFATPTVAQAQATDTPAPTQPQPPVVDPNMPAPVVSPPAQDPTMPSPVSPPPAPTPVEPPTMPPVPDMPSTPEIPASPTPVEPPVTTAPTGTDTKANNPMNSILTDLEQKSETPAGANPPAANLPSIPDFQAKQ